MSRVELFPVKQSSEDNHEVTHGPRTKIELVSLESVYQGYIEAQLRFSLYELFPTHVDNDAYTDEYLAAGVSGGFFNGAPVRSNVAVAPEDFLIPTTLDDAIEQAARYAKEVRSVYKTVGFGAGEAYDAFATQIFETLQAPPLGYIGGQKIFIEALSHVSDVITGESLSVKSLTEYATSMPVV